jgi:acetyl-CoA carboxylase biotin carboxyl carrier protein
LLDIEKIRELVSMMVANDLVEVSLRDGTEEINLRRPQPGSPGPAGLWTAPAINTAMPPTSIGGPANTVGLAPVVKAEDHNLIEITSPMVGTFYAAPDPETPSFVQVGSPVHPGLVVCILEAMKVFNEIKAEVSGTIERILVRNAQAVEYGQPLFLVRPA